MPGFAHGFWVGGKYEPAGVVHKGSMLSSVASRQYPEIIAELERRKRGYALAERWR